MTALAPLARRNPAPFHPRLPGSKSATQRALLLAAMRPGRTTIANGLHCDDTAALARALAAFDGITVATADGFVVTRAPGRLRAPGQPLDLAGAGTAARFLLGFAASVDGATVVGGSARLCERPMHDLIHSLRAFGIRCDELGAPGCLPARVHGGAPEGRIWHVASATSSQFASALLLLASQQPPANGPIELWLDGQPVSTPYLDLTRAMMVQSGLRVDRPNPACFVVHPGTPQHDCIEVEPDASSAGYFLAMAAITGTTVVVSGLGSKSTQADLGIAPALARMGCDVTIGEHEVRLTGKPVHGKPLHGIDVDLAQMPDAALTLAIVAATAEGTSCLTGLATLRHKESNRLDAAARELARLGVRVDAGADYLRIEPTGALRPSAIDSYEDHRVAMAFACLGLVTDGIAIGDRACVTKSFPGFWDEFARFAAHHDEARVR